MRHDELVELTNANVSAELTNEQLEAVAAGAGKRLSAGNTSTNTTTNTRRTTGGKVGRG
jgi:hypothetical protein